MFRVSCSKGTYVRTLVEDIARRAGTLAHTSRLHRESVGHFRESDMLDLSVIESLAERGWPALEQRLMAPDIALQGFPAVTLEHGADERFTGGQLVSVSASSHSGLARVYAASRRFLGVGELVGRGQLAPRRVFLMQEKNR